MVPRGKRVRVPGWEEEVDVRRVGVGLKVIAHTHMPLFLPANWVNPLDAHVNTQHVSLAC